MSVRSPIIKRGNVTQGKDALYFTNPALTFTDLVLDSIPLRTEKN